MVASSTGLDRPYVADGVGTLRCVMVAPPDAAIERERPVHGESGAIAERALAQFAILKKTLAYYGVRVIDVAPPAGLSGASAIADCALVLRDGAILGRPAALERRAEIAGVEAALKALEVPILARIESPGTLNCADVALAGDTAFVGITPGTNALGRAQLRDVLRGAGLKMVEVPLVPSAGRLRRVFTPVAADAAVVAPDKVDVGALGGLRLIEIPPGEDAAAAVLVLRPNSVLADLRFVPANRAFKRAKIAVEAIDLYEYAKIGLGPALIVLPVARKS